VESSSIKRQKTEESAIKSVDLPSTSSSFNSIFVSGEDSLRSVTETSNEVDERNTVEESKDTNDSTSALYTTTSSDDHTLLKTTGNAAVVSAININDDDDDDFTFPDIVVDDEPDED